MWGEAGAGAGALWGEVEDGGADLLGLTVQEREGLATTSRTIAVEGPKFHQPVQVVGLVVMVVIAIMELSMLVLSMVLVTVSPRAGWW